MKKLIITSVEYDPESTILTATVVKAKDNKQTLAEELHICQDGTARRTDSADDSAADCRYFIDDEENMSMAHILGANNEEEGQQIFNKIMTGAFEKLEQTDDHCLLPVYQKIDC